MQTILGHRVERAGLEDVNSFLSPKVIQRGQSSLLTQRSAAKIELYWPFSISTGLGDGFDSIVDVS
jgi:hypothetical protein